MVKKTNNPLGQIRLRTPNDVAQAAIDRFTTATATGASVDADAWKRAISDEVRVFSQEILKAAAKVAGAKTGKIIIESLADVAG